MRVFAVALACVGLATVSACSNTDKLFFREGVGSSLYGYNAGAFSDTASTPTQLQNLYVDEMCKQAGFPSGFCNIENSDPRLWRVFVEAGMNDIDQRCDAYLIWLDNIRRGKAPLIKEVADVQAATTVIMTATGVGATPIAVVAAALGLATSTIDNVTSRLVLEVDHSTVQAVVLGHQKEYREQLFGTNGKPGVAIVSRPAAIYALRSYLRLCMPMTIEMQINGIVASVSAGGAPALVARKPVISAKTVGVTAPVIKVRSTFGHDEAGEILTRYLYPNGVMKDRDKQADAEIRAFLAKNNIRARPGFFIDAAIYADQRKALVADLRAKNLVK